MSQATVEGARACLDRLFVMLGKFISNVKVIAVNDSAGNSVFANVDEQSAPAMIIFAVPEDISCYDSDLLRAVVDEHT